MARDGENWLGIYIKQIYYPTYSRLDGLLAGVTLAVIRIFRPAWWMALARRGHMLLAVGLALVAAAMYLSLDRFTSVAGAAAVGVVFAFPLLSLGLGLIVASALSQNGLLSRWRLPGAKRIATLAYTLYLSHKGILHLTTIVFPRISNAGGIVWIALFALAAFAASAVLYLLVERPFMLLRDKLLHQHAEPVERELRTEPAL
jgi:peptidoglycan/LPS O-acetylase OafA/YrhL